MINFLSAFTKLKFSNKHEIFNLPIVNMNFRNKSQDTAEYYPRLSSENRVITSKQIQLN